MKNRSRFMAVILAVRMLACLLPTAVLAAETAGTERVAITAWPTTGGTITITASHADDSFALYKVVDITYDSTTNQVSYAFTTAAGTYANSLNHAVTIDDYKANNFDAASFLGGYAAYVKNAANNVTANDTTTASNNTASFTGLGMGQYMVLGTGSSTGVYVYQPMTATFAPNDELFVNTTVSLTSKSSAPTITKKIQKGNAWVEKKDVAVGEDVTYQLTATVPTYPAGATNKTFTITDTLPAGLSYVANSANPEPTSVNGQVLTWDINLDTYQDFVDGKVVITDQATVVDAILAAENDHKAINTAELTYGYEPYGDFDQTISNETTVYTYGIEITKTDAADVTKKLPGVVFEVHKDNAEGEVVGTITTDENGIAKLDGLALGTYYIKETKAATGYALPADGISVTLTDAALDGILDNEGETDAVLNYTITNTEADYTLPQTGGMGTWMFTIGGLVLMAGAVVLLLVMRKKREAQN